MRIKSYEKVGRNEPMDFAEVTISTRGCGGDGLDEIVQHICNRCNLDDFYLSADITPCYMQRRGIYATNLGAHRAITIRSRMCESHYTAKSVDDDTFYRIWSEEFIEMVKSTMIFIGCSEAIIYFHGEGRDRIVPLAEA